MEVRKEKKTFPELRRFFCISRFVLACVAVFLGVKMAGAFSGEDFLHGNPWYHQTLTEEAALECGFTRSAADSIKWHADFIDSYAYNPVWWMKGGLSDPRTSDNPLRVAKGALDRTKVSLATYPELAKLHFDDLFSTQQVGGNWHRILSGTLLGLLWAKERGDVSAAHNIIGVSLHAIQDFYSHSNWVDVPERRRVTWFEVPPAERNRMTLWTGAYERPVQLGIKPHGKIAPAASILMQPGIRDIMPLVCLPFSPLSNSSLCDTWKNIQEARGVEGRTPSVFGIPIPDNVIYFAPPGIALDSKWMSNIAVQVRGITDVHGEELFQIAYDLAKRSSIQWLKILEAQMNALGAGEFWRQIKNSGFSEPDRTKQFEHYNRFPYTFLSAGPYPTPAFITANDNQFFLRVRLTTGTRTFSGTDADIYLEAGGKRFLLDYLPRANPILAYNDFEAGDDTIYVVGPFNDLPSSIVLHNSSATGWELVTAFGQEFGLAIGGLISGAGSFLLTLVAGHADHVKDNKKIWNAEELARVGTTGSAFDVPLNGGTEGNYTVRGTIRKIREGYDANGEWVEYQVTLDRLHCNKESTWDRGSNSDEPFVLALLVPLPGEVQKHLAGPYSDVDSGESRDIRHTFAVVRIPKNSGMLSLALSLWESDDESSTARRNLLDKFAGEADRATGASRRGFLTALGTAIAADWQLAHIEIYAFSRVGSLRSGKVLDRPVNQWVKAGARMSFPLDRGQSEIGGSSPLTLKHFL